MKIQSGSDINFRARTPEIRFADDIARKVNQEFPRISSSKMKGFKNINQYLDLHWRIKLKISNMRVLKHKASNAAHTFSKKLLAITSFVKEHKVGNCAESAQLTEIAARANGIKDCACVYVSGHLGYNGQYNFDHAVLLVKNNNKPYIIDSWLGFADYLPEATKRYQKDFRMHFDFDKCINEEMHFNTPVKYNPTGEIFAKKYSVEKLKTLYQELVLKQSEIQKPTLMQRLKLLFNL